MTATLYDAAVIGGGLAGCSAAIHLASRGKSVVVLEARTYPHHKVCGEFLSPECAALLDDLGLTAELETCQPARIHIARITAPDGTSWTARFPGTALGISRYALDHLLARQTQRCGVDFRQASTVTGVEGNLESGFILGIRVDGETRHIRARTVIGAHGKRGIVDRLLQRPFTRKAAPYIALKTHMVGAPLADRIDLHSFPGGYCGMSQVEGGRANICLLARESVFRRCGSIPAFIAWMRGQNPYLAACLSNAQPCGDDWISIAQVSFARKHPLDGDILMAGDSAGLIAPLAGDGMAMALRGGALAAGFAARFLESDLSAAGLRQAYPSTWQREFAGRLRLSAALQALMFRPRALAWGLRLVNHLPGLGQFIIHHTRDLRLIHP